MSTKKTNQAKTPELSPAVMAHQTTVRRLFRKAVTYPAYIYPLGSVKATCEILVKLYNKDARVPTNLKY